MRRTSVIERPVVPSATAASLSPSSVMTAPLRFMTPPARRHWERQRRGVDGGVRVGLAPRPIVGDDVADTDQIPVRLPADGIGYTRTDGPIR